MLSTSNVAVKSYDLDIAGIDFGSLCTVTVTLEMKHPWRQGHDTPLGHRKHLCEISLRSDKGLIKIM